ncbi:MAG TPA: protein phosphatase 2C domain-containing protein [Pyrinomonadaceae bacterium]|nr:protein phosphatase 2C domain-containing protein [Pyrinomonadaceae bacterium]
MSESNTVAIEAAAISDRGLSEKRPLNEDSYLADKERRIFAVADGVGGAQAGEVASKTAVEVLDEAFRHQVDGADIEDLMEIAIQRANSSIFQMAQESPKLAAMATTVVALHLDGHIATIGHVGDSRLYRISPDTSLHRETADHSVVEEEVRAGRMTPEQAAHHPSRNVISRALGAESGVEVDMKTIEVEDGTAFLLCSDGITRHLPDSEIRDLLVSTPDVEAVCAEMKRRCYERGAEDNLTAVIVRVGDFVPTETFDSAAERTVPSARADQLAATSPNLHETVPADAPPIEAAAAVNAAPVSAAPPAASTAAAPVASSALPPPPVGENNAHETNPVLALESEAKTAKRKGGGGARALLLLILFAGIAAAAFYGGIYYQRKQAETAATASATPVPTPTPVDTIREFENKRQQVDKDPANMVKTMRDEAAAKGVQNPTDSTDPEFLYLYGRGLVLMGDNLNAMTAFDNAIANLKENASPLHDKLRVEARLASLAVALRLRTLRPDAEQKALRSFDELINKGSGQLGSSQ